MNPNFHVTEFLDYYLGLNVSPEYAVLLRGKWGAGKSWFIKDYMKSRNSYEYLYVSLNGVSSYKEIEDILFQQLHPILSHKGMKLLGKIAKGLVKTAVKIDLNHDGKEDGSISSGIPDIDFQDFLKKIESKILVFDDLERCSMPIPTILGYLNQYVENNGLKVIVLANELEIIKTEKGIEENTKAYLIIKEKLFGRSFDIATDLTAALKSFISVCSSDCLSFLNNKEQTIRELFFLAGYENLRHLRQGILDFDRFWKFLPQIAKENKDLMDHIVKLFFAITFEVKKGVVNENHIEELFHHSIWDIDKHGNDRSPMQKIRDKYPVFNFSSNPISPDLWKQYFLSGSVDRELLENSIKTSFYYRDQNTPDWAKLFYYYNLNDEEFLQLSKSVFEKLQKTSITEKYELMHVVGLLMQLSQNKLIPHTKSELKKLGDQNLIYLKEQNLLILKKHEVFPSDSSNGLYYSGHKIPEFENFLKKAHQVAHKVNTDNYPKIAEGLLTTLEESVDDFIEKITLTNSTNNEFYDIPILKSIKIDAFLKTFSSLDNTSKKKLFWELEKRYNHFHTQLKPELPWLLDVKKRLLKLAITTEGTISSFVIKNVCVNSLDKSISALSI